MKRADSGAGRLRFEIAALLLLLLIITSTTTELEDRGPVT